MTEPGRPGWLLVVAGTATEVGKTWVGAALARDLREAGWVVGARKPVQSFEPDDPAPTDAACLAAATGESPQKPEWQPMRTGRDIFTW